MLAGVVAFDFRINVTVDLQDVGPTVVVVVDKTAAPRDILIVDADAGREGDVGEGAVAVVVIEVAGVVGEICLENIEPAVAIVVGDADAHAGLLVAVFAVGDARDDSNIGERAVVIVAEQNARLRIDGDVDVGPAVVVEIVGDRGDRVARARLEDAGFFGDVGESAVAVVVIEDVGVAGQARAGRTSSGMPFHWHTAARRFRRRGFGIELDVVADEKIEIAVAIVVDPGAAGAPADLFFVEAGFLRDVGECAVAVVVKQNVVAPEAAEEIVPAVVVVVADADAGLPAGAREAGFRGDVGEGSVAIIFVEMRGRLFAGFPIRVEARAVGQINVEPAVVVVVEKGEAAAFGFDDVVFVIDAAPDVGRG